MNKKIVYKTEHGNIRYCVIDPKEDSKLQLEQVFGITPGYGYTVEMNENEIRIVDYFAGDTRAYFSIISIEECQLPVILEQVNM